VVSEELQKLEEAWGIGGQEQPSDSTEHAVSKFLRKVAQNSERCFVQDLLRPVRRNFEEEEAHEDEDEELDEDDEEAQLIAAKEKLEAAIARQARRSESLDALAKDLEEQRGRDVNSKATATSCRDLARFVEELKGEVQSFGGDDAAAHGAEQDAAALEQCLQKLTVVEQYMQRTHLKLEDGKKVLEERERAAASQGTAHFRSGFTESLRRIR